MAATGFRKKEGLTFKEDRQPLMLPLLLAASGGLLQTLSWLSPSWWPLCLVALAPLILAVDGQSGKRAFFLGWIYGLVLSFSSLPWLADVLVGYGGLGRGLGWLIFSLLAMFLALYQGLFGWLITLCIPSPFCWALIGSVAWCGLDWLKNWVFTGFNWTPLAGPLALSPELGQAADLVGFYGLGFFVALINFCLVIVFYKSREGLKSEGRVYLAGALALILAAFGYGWHKFSLWEEAADRADQRLVAAVQPSTDQAVKWDGDYLAKLLERYELLAKKADSLEPWLVVWPETAMPFIYGHDFDESQWLNRISRESKAMMLIGTAGITGIWPAQTKLHNRMIYLDGGESYGFYDKRHLVPFGEYVPLDWLPFLKWAFMQGLIGAAGTYDPGLALAPIKLPLDPDDITSRQVPLGFLICFESTFPYLGREKVLEGAELLVVPTNDGWFGLSRAPEQHLWQASMRAIETRRPVVRVGNTGISAVIHPSGEIAWRSRLMDVGAYPLKTPILKPADVSTTFFVAWGHWLAPAMAALTGLLILIRFFKKQK